MRALDVVGLGDAPEGPDLAQRIDALAGLLRDGTDAPALVLAAVAHGELLACRPFTHGNGLVARAVERALVTSRGLDPTAVAVVEAGHQQAGSTAYLTAAGGYVSGTPRGLAAWLIHCAAAVAAGAVEGARLADDVSR